jgi:hypothetical protein
MVKMGVMAKDMALVDFFFLHGALASVVFFLVQRRMKRWAFGRF